MVQQPIAQSPLYLLHISLQINYEYLTLDQDDNFYSISLHILITCLLDNVRILWEEVSCDHFWELKGKTPAFITVLFNFRPVHGLIFLFKWKPGEEPAGPIVHESRSLGIFFAKQVSSSF